MNKWVKRGLLGTGAVIGTVGAVLGIYVGVQVSAFDASMKATYDVPPIAIHTSKDPAIVARGEHLARSVSACMDPACHGADGGGGKPIKMGPVATFNAPNITPTGVMAAYSDENLARLIRYGLKQDGHSVRFMPVPDFNWFSDADVSAVVSYLRTLPPVDRTSGETTIGVIGKVLDRRGGLSLDVARAVAKRPFTPPPAPAPTVEFGNLLVRLCTGCHGETLSGGKIPGSPSNIPIPSNITPDASGIAAYTYDDFAKLLDTGVRKNGATLDPFMPLTSIKNFDETERHALWAALRALPPKPFGGR